ncbi:virulence RhuM family protein [Propionivibrio limicola]|uniref:virulence RhuM family protein n=1 Tax=Propionivibrio limicola TaxID=167645 RepID=UPI001B86CB2C|nr:RhuM family protein [Propionivibrio limicola]
MTASKRGRTSRITDGAQQQSARGAMSSIVRSSAAEYLTSVAASGQGGVEAVHADESIWLTQKMMGVLYDVDVRTVNYHLKKVFSDSELEADSVIRKFRITAADGKTYDTQHYSLAAIIAVGYKVNSERAVQFRKWATRIIEEFTVKGFTKLPSAFLPPCKTSCTGPFTDRRRLRLFTTAPMPGKTTWA